MRIRFFVSDCASLPSPAFVSAIIVSPLLAVQLPVAKPVNGQRPAIGHKISGVHPFDYRAPLHPIPWSQRFPAINLRFSALAAPENPPLAYVSVGRIRRL